MDITKYVSKDSSDDENINDFYADFEDYESGIQELEMESGDRVIWKWGGNKYTGILRNKTVNNDGMFDIHHVKKITA